MKNCLLCANFLASQNYNKKLIFKIPCAMSSMHVSNTLVQDSWDQVNKKGRISFEIFFFCLDSLELTEL